jgi:hypothetical protein
MDGPEGSQEIFPEVRHPEARRIAMLSRAKILGGPASRLRKGKENRKSVRRTKRVLRELTGMGNDRPIGGDLVGKFYEGMD